MKHSLLTNQSRPLVVTSDNAAGIKQKKGRGGAAECNAALYRDQNIRFFFGTATINTANLKDSNNLKHCYFKKTVLSDMKIMFVDHDLDIKKRRSNPILQDLAALSFQHVFPKVDPKVFEDMSSTQSEMFVPE